MHALKGFGDPSAGMHALYRIHECLSRVPQEIICTVPHAESECSGLTQDSITSSQIFTKLLQLTHSDALLSQRSLSQLLSELQVDLHSPHATELYAMMHD